MRGQETVLVADAVALNGVPSDRPNKQVPATPQVTECTENDTHQQQVKMHSNDRSSIMTTVKPQQQQRHDHHMRRFTTDLIDFTGATQTGDIDSSTTSIESSSVDSHNKNGGHEDDNDDDDDDDDDDELQDELDSLPLGAFDRHPMRRSFSTPSLVHNNNNSNGNSNNRKRSDTSQDDAWQALNNVGYYPLSIISNLDDDGDPDDDDDHHHHIDRSHFNKRQHGQSDNDDLDDDDDDDDDVFSVEHHDNDHFLKNENTLASCASSSSHSNSISPHSTNSISSDTYKSKCDPGFQLQPQQQQHQQQVQPSAASAVTGCDRLQTHKQIAQAMRSSSKRRFLLRPFMRSMAASVTNLSPPQQMTTTASHDQHTHQQQQQVSSPKTCAVSNFDDQNISSSLK
ncbi:hypothetical protein GZH46_00137, partial [Fragariocoptes setiger]